MGEAKQRWRLVVRRGAGARELAHREVEALWAEGLSREGVPVAMTESARPRPRFVFAAPAPVGALAEHERIDLFLAERLTIGDLRPRIVAALPPGHALVDLHDVWVGEPSIAGRVVAADYRIELEASGMDPARLEAACAWLLAADRLERPRRKGEQGRTYDLRPLIAALEVRLAAPDLAVLWMRLRHHPELGSGRPEEVLAALGERVGDVLSPRELIRERLWLAGEMPPPG